MATWTREQLEEVATRRLSQREELEPAEQAALAFARWQGLTDENGVDREAAKRSLDEALVALDVQGPKAWKDLTVLAEELGDTAIIGLMRHSLSHSIEQLRDPQVNVTSDAEEADQPPKMTRQRGKGLGM